MSLIIFLFMLMIFVAICVKEQIPQKEHYDYYYPEQWMRRKMQQLFVEEGWRRRGVKQQYALCDDTGPYGIRQECYDEVADVFSQIEQLAGMEKYLLTPCPYGLSSNMKIAMLIYNANRGYMNTLDYMGFNAIYPRYSYYNEEAQINDVINLSYKTMQQLAKIISDKYAAYGCPCILVYKSGGVFDFNWVTEANPEK